MLKLNLTENQNPSQKTDVEIRIADLPQREFWIGRQRSCQLFLDNPRVSRQHAKIVWQPDGYYFTDVGSRGGSSLNHQPITPLTPYRLALGDRIGIADFTLVVKALELYEEETTSLGPIDYKQPKLRTPADYMPVALIDPAELTRWHKGKLTVRCSRIIEETLDVKTFCFVAEPPLLFTYKPGQFVTLELEIEGEQVLRSYSISSTPSRPHTLEITVKRVPPPDGASVAPGQVSNWLHDHIQVGQTLKLSGPLGKFTCFAQPAPKLLLISAGSGITPMMSMTRWLFDTAAGCDVVFFHSARTPEDIIFRQELEILACRMPDLKLALTISRRKYGQIWSGLTGRLTPEMLRLIAPDYSERQIYVCGPNSFMEGVKEMMTQLNFPMQHYFEESFGAKKSKKTKSADEGVAPIPEVSSPAVKKQGFGLASVFGELVWGSQPELPSVKPSPEPAAVAPRKVIENATMVVFTKSNKKVSCGEDVSILELAEQEGVKIRSSCRAGSCGTCKKLKPEGTVQMAGFDPEALEPSEQAAGYILTCVAYPRGRVVVDA